MSEKTAYGSDRVRVTGGRIILLSAAPKGWTARQPRTTTSVEHPGTAVEWEDELFEVVAAEAAHGGSVRYVLEPWREEATMRVIDRYDPETEAYRVADHARVIRQQRHSALSRLSSILLGNLPAAVQNRLGDELGLIPSRMTVYSAIPAVFLLGFCTWRASGIALGVVKPGVPIWLWILACAWATESFVRFQVAMSQARPMGSLAGVILYVVAWYAGGRRSGWASPFTARGEGRVVIEPAEDVAIRDAVNLRGPLLALLAPCDQQRLARTVGFDYRRHAFGVTWLLLTGSGAGLTSLWNRALHDHAATAMVSFALALVVAADQLRRLSLLRRGPVGSVLAPLVRPFARDLLERE